MVPDPLLSMLFDFVRSIGIPVELKSLEAETFLPGLDIRHGTVLIDPDRLLYPGDILHEAGHIAVASSEERSYPSLTPTAGDEIATLAWSWAAVVHLDLPPEVLFHPAGYKGGSAALIERSEEHTSELQSH